MLRALATAGRQQKLPCRGVKDMCTAGCTACQLLNRLVHKPCDARNIVYCVPGGGLQSSWVN